MIESAILKRSHESIANSFEVVDFVGCLFCTLLQAKLGSALLCIAMPRSLAQRIQGSAHQKRQHLSWHNSWLPSLADASHHMQLTTLHNMGKQLLLESILELQWISTMAGKPLAKGFYKWLTALEWAGWERGGALVVLGLSKHCVRFLEVAWANGQPLHKKNLL